MHKTTDIQPVDVALYFQPAPTRVPLKFGHETLRHVICARVCMVVENRRGDRAEGWGETPLSVAWVWPGNLSYESRQQALQDFSVSLAKAWTTFRQPGHPIETGHAFQTGPLPELLEAFNAGRHPPEAMPWLAALVCCASFDIALHDAFGNLLGLPVYKTYDARFMNADLSHYLTADNPEAVRFSERYPDHYLDIPPADTLPVWHLVGGTDAVEADELTGSEPDDGYPVLLRDWIRADGLKCLKIKLRGNDADWDYRRILRVGKIALDEQVHWLTTDFNCTVSDPAYVNAILDRLMRDHPRLYGMMLYVEQPFPYDLEHNRIDVHSLSARKPLFLDESAHDWQLIRLGRQLGWTGVALKTCKTQTGALLSLCWAKAHGMTLMVQDLTNPMLAQIPHCLLAAHAGTIMGVESNAMQFYPEVSTAEARVHPGLYRRRRGVLDLSSIQGAGFGYRLTEIDRTLSEPAFDSRSN